MSRLHWHKIEVGRFCLTFYDLWARRYCFEITWSKP